MAETRPFQFIERVRSFRYAIAGIGTMLRSQHNAWIHAAATAGACVAGFALEISRAEWCWVVSAVVAVWTAEALNTAFEFLADAATPEFHPLVKSAKDVAAAAVLIAAVGATIIGILVFGPHLVQNPPTG
jgi:diacylglycerol kinase (ATP)